MLQRRRLLAAVTLATTGILLAGCALGPAALRASRVPYNEVIQRTTNEQLLLNLVRLQYREAPLFLEVGSVAAQFSFRESANIDGTINEGVRYAEGNNPNVLELVLASATRRSPPSRTRPCRATTSPSVC